MSLPNYYEILQVNPNAETETVRRVYRFLAGRLNQNKSGTGDTEKLSLLREAHEVLANPARRAEYDAASGQPAPQTAPQSASNDFVNRIQDELHRRLSVLAVLYFQRRAQSNVPEISLAEVESLTGFQHDHLGFTIWYLHKKGFITRVDNSQLMLTADGVDFVESQRESIPILDKLLASEAAPDATGSTGNEQASDSSASPNLLVFANKYPQTERRIQRDRRMGKDRRTLAQQLKQG